MSPRPPSCIFPDRPVLTQLSGDVSLVSFCPEGLIGIGVPIGNDAFDGWDTPSKVWTHMVLHLSYIEGGFGVTFNDVTKDTVFYTTTFRIPTWFFLSGTSEIVVAQG
jgi:hypothetical protein